MCIAHGTYTTTGVLEGRIQLRIRRYPPIIPWTPASGLAHLKSPHSTYFLSPDSEKLTFRDLAVLWLYNQITPRALMDFKGVLQLQIAAEIGPSESGVSSWVVGPPHVTGMALNLTDFGDNRPLDTPQSPPNTPGDLSACIYTTGTHKGG